MLAMTQMLVATTVPQALFWNRRRYLDILVIRIAATGQSLCNDLMSFQLNWIWHQLFFSFLLLWNAVH